MSTLRSDRTNSADWGDHEHVADSAKAQAQQLVEQVGSVDLAKQALDAVGELMQNSADPLKSVEQTDRQKNFCQALGFESCEELVQHSSPTASNDGKDWFETELSDGSWIVWNQHDLQADRHFASRDEALASVPHEDKLSGSSLLG